MSQIASECGVSKALLYHYYTNKEELVFDILSSYLESLDTVIAEADRPDLPPMDRLGHLVHTTLDHYRDSDDQHKVLLGAMRALPSEKLEALRDIERSVVQRVASVIARVNPALAKDRTQLMPVTMCLFGMMNWVYMWFRDQGPLSRDDLSELITRLTLDGVRSLNHAPRSISLVPSAGDPETAGRSQVR